MKFVNFIRRRIRAVLIYFGIVLDVVTPRDKILSLLEKIKPFNTNHKLIRVGGNSDGGYLIPDDLHGVSASFSPGVSHTSDFEEHLADKRIRSYMADFSVSAPPVLNDLFVFDKKFLGIEDNETSVTLQTWTDTYEPNNSDLILQMDIEGAEYATIHNTSEMCCAKV